LIFVLDDGIVVWERHEHTKGRDVLPQRRGIPAAA
jgi:hypothetical protein